MIYLSTPFSLEAAKKLKSINIKAFKIGSGECNNIPLIKEIAKFKKPIILSTGMNDLQSIKRSVNIMRSSKAKFALRQENLRLKLDPNNIQYIPKINCVNKENTTYLKLLQN